MESGNICAIKIINIKENRVVWEKEETAITGELNPLPVLFFFKHLFSNFF